jgi:hypothetical protein
LIFFSNCNFAETGFCATINTPPESSFQGLFRTVLNIYNFSVSKKILNFEEKLCLWPPTPSELFQASPLPPNNKPILKAKENLSKFMW